MTPEIWALATHFKPSEFDSHGSPGSGANMKPELVVMLEALRRLMNKPFRINSGFRTPEHNGEAGGATHSAHMDGEAVDISTSGWTKAERIDLILYARKLGFTGIGVGSSFIHIDMKARGHLASWIYRGSGTAAIFVGREAEYA